MDSYARPGQIPELLGAGASIIAISII